MSSQSNIIAFPVKNSSDLSVLSYQEPPDFLPPKVVFSKRAVSESAEQDRKRKKHSDQSVEAKFNAAKPHYSLGKALAKKGEWKKAISSYQKALSVDSNSAEIYHYLGNALVKNGELEEAVRVYQKAIELQPNLWEVHHNLGDMWQGQGRLEEAIAAYRRAIEFNPDFSWSHNNLGDSLIKQEKWEEAAVAYGRAIELNPDFHWSYYNLGEALVELKRWEEAVVGYRRAIQLKSDLPFVYEKLGDALRNHSPLSAKEAISYYNQAIQESPDNIKLYHKALDVNPKDPTLYLGLGNALIKQGQRDGAIVFYQMGLQLNPGDFEIYLQLWKALLQINDGFEDVGVQSQADLIDFCGEGKVHNKYSQIPLSFKFSPVSHSTVYLVDIVLCVHNALEDVKECLNSVIRHTKVDYRLLIVDDGSQAETRDFLKSWVQEHSVATLFRNETARGYTKAANIGLRASKGDYVILLNSDTIVTPGWIEKLIECATSRKDIGIVGPLSNCASWQSIPEIFDKNGGWMINNLPEGYSLEMFNKIVTNVSEKTFPCVSFVNGFCYMIKRAVIDAIGWLDEESFPYGYGEENDFSIRARKAGFKLAIADHAYVYHSKSRSFGHERRQELSKQGSAAFKSKHPDINVKALTEEIKNNQALERLRLKLREHIVPLGINTNN